MLQGKKMEWGTYSYFRVNQCPLTLHFWGGVRGCMGQKQGALLAYAREKALIHIRIAGRSHLPRLPVQAHLAAGAFPLLTLCQVKPHDTLCWFSLSLPLNCCHWCAFSATFLLNIEKVRPSKSGTWPHFQERLPYEITSKVLKSIPQNVIQWGEGRRT